MRRLLCLLPVALLFGCSSYLGPTPVVQQSSSPSPVAIVCGPLSSDPADCAAAVEAAVRIKDPAVDWASIRIDAPEETCTGATSPCRAPTVIVRFLGTDPSVVAAEVPLVQGTSGWVFLGAIR